MRWKRDLFPRSLSDQLPLLSRHTFDKESARTVSNLVQKILFLFACTNSSMNPIVYGIFHTQRKKKQEHIIVTQISSLSKRSERERSTCQSI